MKYFTFLAVLCSLAASLAAEEKKPANKPKAEAKKAAAKKSLAKMAEGSPYLRELAVKLMAAVTAGKLTKQQAIARYKEAASKAQGKLKGKDAAVDLEELGAKLKKAVADGTLTEKEAIARYEKAAAQSKGKKGGKTAKKRKGQYGSFYSIVIGRLKSKDLELGEFTLEVDHVTSIYGDRKLKDTIIGKTVKVVGVSGPWLDKLLLIKRGKTLKLRSGTLQGTTISLSPKATVLERAAPFDPKTYPIPPESFRGFQGVVLGTIVSKSDQGYDMTMRVEKVVDTFKGNKAAKPASIEGRLMDMRGFYDQRFRSSFDDLRIGDKIRVGAAHRVPEIDSLEVTQVLEKAGGQNEKQ